MAASTSRAMARRRGLRFVVYSSKFGLSWYRSRSCTTLSLSLLMVLVLVSCRRLVDCGFSRTLTGPCVTRVIQAWFSVEIPSWFCQAQEILSQDGLRPRRCCIVH